MGERMGERMGEKQDTKAGGRRPFLEYVTLAQGNRTTSCGHFAGRQADGE